jgi:hypothetical protein
VIGLLVNCCRTGNGCATNWNIILACRNCRSEQGLSYKKMSLPRPSNNWKRVVKNELKKVWYAGGLVFDRKLSVCVQLCAFCECQIISVSCLTVRTVRGVRATSHLQFREVGVSSFHVRLQLTSLPMTNHAKHHQSDAE